MKRKQEICFQQPSERERSVSAGDEPGPEKEKPRPPRSCVLSLPQRNPTRVFLPPVPLSGSPSLPLSLRHPHPRRRSGNWGLPAPPRRRYYGGAGDNREQLLVGQAPLSRPRGLPPPPGPRPHTAGPSSVLLTRSSDPPPGSSHSP